MTVEKMLPQVQRSLEDGIYACTSLEPLSGGSANFVYRGILATPLEDRAKTVVIKHTEGYVATHPGFKLTADRCVSTPCSLSTNLVQLVDFVTRISHLTTDQTFEQEILTALQDFQPTTSNSISIQTPKLYHFFPETNTQIYSDFSSSTELKTYILTHTLTRADCSRLGTALGHWTKTFHQWAAAPEQEGLRKKMRESKVMRKLKFDINYTTLLAIIENFPDLLEGSRGVFEEVVEEMRGVLENLEDEGDGGVLVHGDFWSGKYASLFCFRSCDGERIKWLTES